MSKPEVEDFLSEDPEVSSQKVVLLSFLSPEKVLANKDVFLFQNFLKDYDLQWRTTKLEAFLVEQFQAVNTKLEVLAGKLNTSDLSGASQEVRDNLLRVDRFVEEFKEFTRKSLREAAPGDIQEEYETFLFKNSAKLEEEFFAKNEFRTTIRGIKVRGVFPSEAEAAVKAKRLQKSDPSFNIYMGSVGKWMAWEPDPNKVVDQEYANDQLNSLMKKYRENEESREQFYTEQKKKRVGASKTNPVDSDDTKVSVSESASASVPAADTEGTEGTEGTPFTAGANAGGNYDGMFSGPADLAIARKMEK